jgi:hypothetical protein
MKIKHLLILLLTILYGYWMSDLYIFIYNNNIYDPNILDDTFSEFKVTLYCFNYVTIVITIILILFFTNIGDKIINILNKPIKFKKYEN